MEANATHRRRRPAKASQSAGRATGLTRRTAQPRVVSRSRNRRSSVWRLDNTGSDDALAVQLLDAAPREIGKESIFVASYQRFELGHMRDVMEPRTPAFRFQPEQCRSVIALNWEVRIAAMLMLAFALATAGVRPSWSGSKLSAINGGTPGPYNPNEPVSPQPARGGS
jgi:hypothetical protein